MNPNVLKHWLIPPRAIILRRYWFLYYFLVMLFKPSAQNVQAMNQPCCSLINSFINLYHDFFFKLNVFSMSSFYSKLLPRLSLHLVWARGSTGHRYLGFQCLCGWSLLIWTSLGSWLWCSSSSWVCWFYWHMMKAIIISHHQSEYAKLMTVP